MRLGLARFKGATLFPVFNGMSFNVYCISPNLGIEDYAVCHNVLIHNLRIQVLRVLVKIYQGQPNPDYLSICQCLMFLDDSSTVATILDELIKGDKVRLD
jgi:hypothetical protein